MELRKNKNLSQKSLARMVGISQQHYSCIESGWRNPHQKAAKKIAKALGFDWIRFFEDEEPAQTIAR